MSHAAFIGSFQALSKKQVKNAKIMKRLYKFCQCGFWSVKNNDIEMGNKGPRTMGSLNCNNADHRKFLLKSQMHLNCKLGFLLVDEVFVLQPDVDIRAEQM